MRVGNCVTEKYWLGTNGLRLGLFALLAGLLTFSFSKTASAQFFTDDGYYSYQERRAAYKRRKARQRRARRLLSSRRRTSPKEVAKAWKVDESNNGPVQIIISIPDQKGYVYKGGKLITTTRVSTGKRGHATPTGVFSILQKNRRHFSNLYNSAPMPYMQRLTWSGVALHEGHVPGYPASHGCIRLPHGFAKQLFSFTDKGAHVIVTNGNVAPQTITHRNLIQPAPSTTNKVDEVSAQLENDPQVRSVTTSSTVETAARIKSLEVNQSVEIPSHIRRLSGREKIRATQRLLQFLGYKVGRADGDRGRDTMTAIRKFKSDVVLPVNSAITDEFFTTLYKQVDREDVAMGRNKNNPAHAASLAKPVRILVTRRTKAEQTRDAQRLLAFLGYYKGEADGYVGRDTLKAIKRFQDEFLLAKDGTISDKLIATLYKQANEGEVPMGHIYVRQDFREVFDMPMVISDPTKPLGTHLFTAAHFEKGETNIGWLAQSLKEGAAKPHKAKKSYGKKKRKKKIKITASIPAVKVTASEALDRISIPEEARKRISLMLTPGSSMIITDNGLGRETGRGTDFVVLTK